MAAPRTALGFAAAALLGLAVLAPAPALAASGFDPGGSPVVGGGSTDRADRTVLEAGLWSDVLGPEGSSDDEHYFAYDRTMSDSTLLVGVLGAPDAEYSDGVDLEIATPEGDPCASGSGSVSTVGQAPMGASVAAGADAPGERDAACLTADRLELTVSRGIGGDDSTDLPIAIKIVEEAPVSTTGVADLPMPPDSPTFGSGESDAEPAVGPDGSPSPDDAPTVAPGAVLDTSVTEGEVRFWRVPVAWGQAVSVSAEVAGRDEVARAALESYDQVPVELRLLTPLRSPFRDAVEGEEPDGSYDVRGSELSVGSPPVTFLGRFNGSGSSVPGDYWLAVSVGAPDDREPLAVPMRLTFGVDGSEAGAPAFAGSVLSPGDGPGPGGYSPDTPYLVAADTFAADPSGNPVVPGDDAAGSDARRWWGAGLGVLSVLCCAAGAWRLRAGLRVG